MPSIICAWKSAFVSCGLEISVCRAWAPFCDMSALSWDMMSNSCTADMPPRTLLTWPCTGPWVGGPPNQDDIVAAAAAAACAPTACAERKLKGGQGNQDASNWMRQQMRLHLAAPFLPPCQHLGAGQDLHCRQTCAMWPLQRVAVLPV
jgi:hypothetical protein